MTPTHIHDVEQFGFAITTSVVSETSRRELTTLFDHGDSRAGRRDGLADDAIRALAASAAIRDLVSPILGPSAFAVRATLFDKTPSTNWPVAWHQDITIPVRERRDADGFEAWSSKGGIPYVRPPARVLESMLALRIDLDGTPPANGPLRVLPGTHRSGFLGAAEIEEIRRSQPFVECHVPAGGALLMRPLLLHSSPRARDPGHRRIVHLEFAAGDLPAGLSWYDRCAIA